MSNTDKNYKKINTLIKSLIKQKTYIYGPNDLTEMEGYIALKKEKPEVLKPLILTLLAYHEEKHNLSSGNDNHRDACHIQLRVSLAVLGALLRKNQNYTEEEWMEYFTTLNGLSRRIDIILSNFFISYSIQQIERYLKKNELSDKLKNFISEMLNWDSFNEELKGIWAKEFNKSVSKLRGIIQKESDLKFQLPHQDIGEVVNMIIEHNSSYEKKELHQLLLLANTAGGGKPSNKYQKEVDSCIAVIGKENYRKLGQQLLNTAVHAQVEEKIQHYEIGNNQYEHVYNQYLSDPTKQFIKGIVWSMESFSDKETISILSKLLEKAFEKIPGVGPGATAIGNACAYTLGNMRGKDGLGALSRLKMRIKQNNIKKTIDKYLVEGAKKYNVSVEELKEMAVPHFNLENGTKSIAFETFTLNVTIEDSKVVQQWIKEDGTPVKTVPSIVKNSTKLTNQLKEIRKEVKEIQKVYSAQKQRIDNLFILDRTWDFPSFNKYYLAHGLVRPIASKVIWTFTKADKSESLICVNDKWENNKGESADWIDDECTVSLWHPVFATEQEIIDWREKMMDLQWKQPIKQAFRELYILTDAEINTRSYSNRMAAHILKQHQFKTLATIRDWTYSLLNAHDGGNESEICYKHLPEHNITAEYWIDSLNDHDSDAYNDSGIWLYIATDQVKFKDAEGNDMDLIDVPKIAFSEIMRDVDLFVGVASVGNDPEWRDNSGDRQNHRDYWTSYSFGNLTEIAKTRKTILERLLPRLTKLKNKSHIDGKFLIVKGSIRTYKIHIGSGNILMEPNDQYLCIVPARGSDKSTDKLFIPFEGDRGLSIVLSKAFLLVDDKKITDTTIISQIS